MKHIKFATAAAILGSLIYTGAMAQTSPQAKAPAASAATAAVDNKWSTDSLVGDLLDYAPAKAILFKHMPALEQDDQIDQARGMSFRSLQQFAPDVITDAVLAAMDADLAKLPPVVAASASANAKSSTK